VGLLLLRKVTAKKERTATVNKYLTVVAVAFLAISLVQIGYHTVTQGGKGQKTAAVSEGSKAQSTTGTSARPNIYYIILDAYSGEQTLAGLHYDNSAFLQQLQKDEFTIPADEKSNYTSTYPSLASSLNMRYVGKTTALPSDGDLRQMIEYNEVMKFLRSKNYEIVHIGAPYPATSINRYADVSYPGMSPFYRDEFTTALIRMTMARGLIAGDSWWISKEKVMQAFTVIPSLPTDSSKPLFVFAHVLPPHPPYLFDASGKAINPEVKNANQAYLNQLTYVNKRVETLIHDILTKNKVPPIIILQGDHSILYTTNILNAYYLPSGGSSALWSGITPVNTFRMLFDYYFGAHYKPLVNQSP